jgi:predicted ABC-type ATPase
VNAAILAKEIAIDAYEAARSAAAIREELVRQRESFAFETVFSDPVGDKVAFLKRAAEAGYNTILCFVGIASPKVSEQRVAMRVSQGGHDVPVDKLSERFPRTLANLRRFLQELPKVCVFDNSNLGRSYRLVIVAENGRVVQRQRPVPRWLSPHLPG